ncbi:cellulose biosynthesis protein BcsC [Variovorax sp. MHTC-1]|uniref:cellulose biosynthesis protein BcsC n=1 Tax=Variovorax sp. MHTC-1 TaxID=2495593 RepID=UPI0021AFA6D7|nr:cellulose biosynthesis protein BcsC [Variovorax sp. MHTC-1]
MTEQGIYWQSLGRLELAEASWRKLLSADPRSADALYGMSQVELARGNTEAARGWIARLRAAHPGDDRATRFEARNPQPGARATDLQLARSAARAGRTAEAVQMYRTIFNNRPPPEPLALEYYQLLGASAGGWDEGRRGLEQLVRDKPENLDYKLALAQLNTYREPTRREGIRSLVDLSTLPATAPAARASWRQALLWLDARATDAALYRDYLATQSDPAVAQRLQDLNDARPQVAEPGATDPLRPGFAALERGELSTAERRFREALRLRPGNPDALGGLGLVRLRQERFAQAQELLEQASKAGARKWASALRSATYWNLFGQASAARGRNDPSAARSLLERAVQLDSRESAGRTALADLQLEAGDLAAAEQGYARVLERKPGDAQALRGLITTYARQGRVNDALALSRRLGPREADQFAILQSIRIDQARAQARRQEEAGHLADAQRTLEEALVADPSSAWIRHDLALLYRRQGLEAQVRQMMDGLPASQRDTRDDLHTRALLAADAGDPAAALQYLERLPAASRTPAMMQLQRRLWALDQAQRARELARQGQADAARDLLARTESTLGADVPRETIGPLALAYGDAGETTRALSLSRQLVSNGESPSVADRLLHASLLFKANQDTELAAVLEQLQMADMTSAQRKDFDALRAGYDARQAGTQLAVGGDVADRSATLTAGGVDRRRDGEPGLGRLSDRQIPIEARIPVGEGRLVLGATPTVLDAGTLAADVTTASRFGGGAQAAQLQSVGAVEAPGAQNARGVGLSVGYERKNLEASIGTTPLGFAETNVIGNLTYRGQFADNVSLKADLSRRPVTDSLLSFAGTRDPRTGVQWGGVIATGARLDLGRDFGRYGIYGYGSAHSITGKNVTTNSRYELGGGVYLPVSRSASSSLTVGMNLDLLSYDKNLSQFTYGQGGYFSPQSYASLTLPLDWSGRDGRMAWRLNASIGVQSFREDPFPSPFATGMAAFAAPGTQRTGVAYSFAAIVEYQVAPQLYLGGALGFNNARDYRQITGNAYLRYVFGNSGFQNVPTGGMTLKPFSSPYTPLL